MDTITKYDVTLFRLNHENVEQVRCWRNSDFVRQYMEFRDEITPAMQEKWFSELNPETQFFYLIDFQGKKIGLVSLKNYKVEEKTAEGGIYLCDEAYTDSPLCYQALFAMYDFGFDVLKLRTITAHIMRDNKRAIRFNKAIGFLMAEGQGNVINQLYKLSMEDYCNKSQPIKKWIEG